MNAAGEGFVLAGTFELARTFELAGTFELAVHEHLTCGAVINLVKPHIAMEKKEIRDAYIKYWLENGKRPVSVYAFVQQLGIGETDFYDKYASFDAVEKDIWRGIFEETLEKLKA